MMDNLEFIEEAIKKFPPLKDLYSDIELSPLFRQVHALTIVSIGLRIWLGR